jgi:hypothetical protein
MKRRDNREDTGINWWIISEWILKKYEIHGEGVVLKSVMDFGVL